MKKLELENFGVVEMDGRDMVEVDGGKFPSWAKKFGWAWLVGEVIDNWDDIKQGLSDGYNQK